MAVVYSKYNVHYYLGTKTNSYVKTVVSKTVQEAVDKVRDSHSNDNVTIYLVTKVMKNWM